jgi:hypothetical protein
LGSPEFLPFSKQNNKIKEGEKSSSLRNKSNIGTLNEELAIIKRPKKLFTNH